MNSLGNITTPSDKIVNRVAKIVTSTYGVIGISSKDALTEGINFLANKNEFAKGIILIEDNSQISLEIYFVLALDFKAQIVLASLEQNIKIELKSRYQVEIKNINFFITNVGRMK